MEVSFSENKVLWVDAEYNVWETLNKVSKDSAVNWERINNLPSIVQVRDSPCPNDQRRPPGHKCPLDTKCPSNPFCPRTMVFEIMPRGNSYYSLHKTEGFVESNKCRIDAYYPPNCSTFIFKSSLR